MEQGIVNKADVDCTTKYCPLSGNARKNMIKGLQNTIEKQKFQ